jgi:threonyl-tRNA synthetase
MLVIGEKEQAAGKVAVRHRTGGDKGAIDLGEFVRLCEQEVNSRSLTPAAAG